MATLHVRNVPDGLYELLRRQASFNGRSIGAETVVLLENLLEVADGTASRRTPRFVGRRQPPAPFERFDRRARQVIVDAEAEARELGSASLRTEHLLLGLMRPPATVATWAIGRAGIDRSDVMAAVEAASPEGDDVPAEGSVPFSPGAKKALELALRECIAQRCKRIDAGHLLVGIAGAEGELGSRIVQEAGEDVKTLRPVIAGGSGWPAAARSVAPAGFRVVELTGEAEEWETQLNSLAARGYELVEIVDRKAIFRVDMTP